MNAQKEAKALTSRAQTATKKVAAPAK